MREIANGQGDGYNTGFLLDYLHFKENRKQGETQNKVYILNQEINKNIQQISLLKISREMQEL